MSNDTEPTVEERIERRKAAEVLLRAGLAKNALDGPIEIRGSGEPFMAMFGGGPTMIAVCTECGAMVMLDDPMARDDAPPIERGVFLHSEWHGRGEATP